MSNVTYNNDGELVCVLDSANAISVNFEKGIIHVIHEVWSNEIGIDVVENTIKFDKDNLVEQLTDAIEYMSGDFPVQEFIKEAKKNMAKIHNHDKDNNGVDDRVQDSRWNDTYYFEDLDILCEKLIEVHETLNNLTDINVEKVEESLSKVESAFKKLLSNNIDINEAKEIENTLVDELGTMSARLEAITIQMQNK